MVVHTTHRADRPDPDPALPSSSSVTIPESDCNESVKRPAIAGARRLLQRRLRIGITDGRVFVGRFNCLDKEGNIILHDTVEFRRASAAADPADPRRNESLEERMARATSADPNPLVEQRRLGLVLIMAKDRAWESAYGLQRGSLLPPSPLPLPPDLPPPPHLADCAARTLAREAAEGGPWRGTGGGGGDGIRWEDTWQQQTGGKEESLSECCDRLPPRTPWLEQVKAGRHPSTSPTHSSPPPRSSIPPPSPSPSLGFPLPSPSPSLGFPLPSPFSPSSLPFPLPPCPLPSSAPSPFPASLHCHSSAHKRFNSHPPSPRSLSPDSPSPHSPSQVQGTDAANLALTRVAQRDIWAHQMLASAAAGGEGRGGGGGGGGETCEGRRLLVVPWMPTDRHVSANPFHVIASQIHVMADFLGLAMQHNRTLVALPGSYGPALNSDCRGGVIVLGGEGEGIEWEKGA
ncbi:unnamed protein product [Closterium sp. NIES-64]|nr:unnamed protein product [Closterium sp. NIES-64]